MAIQAGFDLLKNAFLGWTPFNITWAFSIIAVVLTMAILTRDFNKWKQLFLPVMISWHIAGITPHFLMYIIGTLLFILENISIEQLGQLAEVTTRNISSALDNTYWRKTRERNELKRDLIKSGWKNKIKDYQEGKIINMTMDEITELTNLGITRKKPKAKLTQGGFLELADAKRTASKGITTDMKGRLPIEIIKRTKGQRRLNKETLSYESRKKQLLNQFLTIPEIKTKAWSGTITDIKGNLPTKVDRLKHQEKTKKRAFEDIFHKPKQSTKNRKIRKSDLELPYIEGTNYVDWDEMRRRIN